MSDRAPRIRRLTLVPVSEDEGLRRYRLARLDDLALATPPYELPEERRDQRNSDDSAAPAPLAPGTTPGTVRAR